MVAKMARFEAFFSNDIKLYISSTSGSVGAEAISVLGDADITGNAAAAASFGLSVGAGPTPAAAGFSAKLVIGSPSMVLAFL